jgi:guanine nucleotide exchange factor
MLKNISPRSRQSKAPDLFLGAYLPNNSGPRTLIGYVCSTLSPDLSLTHASMSQHVPSSSSVCVHSVSISPDYRRKGLGVDLLREYTGRLESATRENGLKSYERVLLITHEELRHFYGAAGFEWLGKSDVVHGSRPWFEMRKVLGESTPPSQEQDQTLPPGVWETLQRTPRSRPVAKRLASFGGMSDVCATDPDNTGNLSNKFDLLCPRQECGSIILKAGVALWVDRVGVQVCAFFTVL